MKRHFNSQGIHITPSSNNQPLKRGLVKRRFSVYIVIVLGLLGIAPQAGITAEPTDSGVPGCPPSALDQSSLHVVQGNETLDSVATTYGLLPSSIVALNPNIETTAVAAGDRLRIPPYNGSLYSVPAGATWQDLADQFAMRADVLFESNGCGMTPPQQVFVPGMGGQVTSGVARQPSLVEPLTFNTLPLENDVAIALGYGWQQPIPDAQAVFHSGVDFEASTGTPVLSVAAGTVAFAGERGSYGNVIVINHDRGVQTRYAQLSDINVDRGDTVTTGEQIGLSGESGDVPMPHLHFEVRLNSPSGWVAQDPSLYLNSLGPTSRSSP